MYADDLIGAAAFSWLNHCEAGPRDPCVTTSNIRTDHRVAHAHNDATSQSVTAWVHKNRNDDADDREIRISPGVDPASPNLLLAPELTGIQSIIPPAVACKEGAAAEGYDCMIAYVKVDDPDGRIRHHFFSISPGGTFTWRPSEFVTVHRTSQGVAIWHHDGWWWRAQVHAATQNIHVYRSADGLGWAFQTDLGFSVQVPAVAAHHTGLQNALFLTR